MGCRQTKIVRLHDFADKAREVVLKSNCRNKMASVVFRSRGKPLAWGVNKKGYRGSSIHAEADALKQVRMQKKRANGANILVCRFRRDGSFGNAKPCINCIEMLNQAGIKKVAWTTANQTIEIARLEDLENDYTTFSHEDGSGPVNCFEGFSAQGE